MKQMVVLALFLLAVRDASAAPVGLPWPVEARKVNAVAVDGDRAYLATGDNRAELVVVDIDTGSTLGTFDAAGGADALSVRVIAAGQVKIGRRQSDAPEVYHLDVSDPAAIAVLDTGERARHVRWRPDPIPPVRFADANGDGVYRMACLGDSNTAPVDFLTKWCELLAAMIPGLEVVNLGWRGATVCPNRIFMSDAGLQLQQALALDVDAVVLAFGTNDRLQRRSVEEIVAAYVLHAEVAAAEGVDVFVATTPPMGGCSGEACAEIYELNQELPIVFSGRVIDFFSGVTDEHFGLQDRIHMSAAGQVLRAERAAARVGNPLRALGR